ncbi:SMEK domain-containing protein [Photobacterium leiognathi]|uniref:SMEK domain-containing protein n=1 Tax=Photobacterium leiognathi TaxID=553611 RepID=UPI0029820567|nr:SMEK domain-containing protein [Photobacterium leiognathi]
MKKQEELSRVSELLGRFAHEVKVSNSIGLFDINLIAEDFLIPILSIALNCPDLKNQNRVQMNFPAVDLGCDKSRVSIQITSDPSSSKISKTLNKFQEHDLQRCFDKVYVYVITERQRTYKSKELNDQIRNFPISFDLSSDIIDYNDLAGIIGQLNSEEISKIKDYLEISFNKRDLNLKFRKEINQFIKVSQDKIKDEISSRKYIPSIFIETSEVKEYARYFINPMFFYRKIDYDLKRINIKSCNDIFDMAKIKPLKGDINNAICLPIPKNIKEVNERFINQKNIIEDLKNEINPFTWRSDKNNKYKPVNELKDYWRVFKFNVESRTSGINSDLEDILVRINIATSKIFLITGMAGQGKTNFICDLVEHQLKYFEVPTIFIPARLLNHYTGPNRILSYITNNRFCPKITGLHELFELLNNVSSDSGKPFIIAIDGINEVNDLQGFVNELKLFLDALCQYDFVRVIITCRNEFFDHKFSEVFEPYVSKCLFRIQDLRNEMSETNKANLLQEYIKHFNIKLKLSSKSKSFLENDLILLRLFCQINEGKEIGHVSEIYKGELFERYLHMKISEFPIEQKAIAISSLRKICHKMIEEIDFSVVSNSGFDLDERRVIDKLVSEDIILRREVPPSGLMSLGLENISFTYDEMRDFLLAYFVVVDVENDNQDLSIFDKMKNWPIYEGLFRYTYILARKHKNNVVISKCESFSDFNEHYANNLSLLSSELQTVEDVTRVKDILKFSSERSEIQSIAWLLFTKRDESEYLNLGILNEHLASLSAEESEKFLCFMYNDYSYISLEESLSKHIESLKDLNDEEKLSLDPLVLVFILYSIPYLSWELKEYILNFFNNYKENTNIAAALASCKYANSDLIQICLNEIEQGVEEL